MRRLVDRRESIWAVGLPWGWILTFGGCGTNREQEFAEGTLRLLSNAQATLKFASDHTAITEQEKKDLQTYFTAEQIIELGLLCVMCMVGRFSMLAGIEAASCAV